MVSEESNCQSSKYLQDCNALTENLNNKKKETQETLSHSKEKDQKPNFAQAAQSNIKAYNEKQNHTQKSQSNTQRQDEKSNHTQDDQKMMSVSVRFKSQSEPAVYNSSGSLEDLLQPFTQISDEQQGQVKFMLSN